MNSQILKLALFPVTLALASCNAAANGDNAPSPTASDMAAMQAGEMVELQKTSPFAAESFGSYKEPWALAIEPGTGNVFLTEKGGTAKFYQPGSGRVGTVSGLPEVAYGGQGGLGDFVFAPDYASSRMVYLSWAKQDAGDARRAVVGRGTLVCEGSDTCAIRGLTEIWQQSVAIDSPGHFSHRIAFSPDGRYLFVSSGDRMQQDPAQDLANNLGTVVRLNLDGTPAAGNPFADRGAPTNQIWSYGHRNLLGLAFSPSGRLYDLEHGPAGGDELNLVQAGANYGWPVRSYGDNYNGDPIPDHTADDGFVKPAIQWTPVIAPGDMIFYTGSMFADWAGDVLIANLRTTNITRVSLSADGTTGTEEARYEFPERLRDIAQGPDGAIWVIEDGDGGRLIRLTPKPEG